MSGLSDLVLDFVSSRRTAVIFLVAAVLFVVFMRYGGGTEMTPIEAEFAPFSAPPTLVAQSDVPLRRIVLALDGNIYGVVHPRFQRDDLKVVKITPQGEVSAFPNRDWQRGVFTRPTSITTDGRGWVWVAEDHPLGLTPARVLAIDPGAQRLMLSPEIARGSLPRGSSLSDMTITQNGMHLVLADSSALGLSPRLIHLDFEQGVVEPKIVRDSALRAGRFRAVVDGVPFAMPGGIKVHREGANAVALTADGESLVFASAANEGLFALPSGTILGDNTQGDNPSTNNDDLLARQSIRKLSAKPWSEAIAVDIAGNVYLTDAAGGRILRLSPSGVLTGIVPPGTFLWPSGLAFGPDGGLYVSETALNQPRWRVQLADVLADAPFGIGVWLGNLVRGNAQRVDLLGVWRIDVGIAGVLG